MRIHNYSEYDIIVYSIERTQKAKSYVRKKHEACTVLAVATVRPDNSMSRD